MGDPGDALQVDAFFVHLVERGHVAQVLDLLDDEVGDVVDLFFRVETTEPETNARVRELVVKSVERLRTLSPLWEMHQDGIDINSIQWTPH